MSLLKVIYSVQRNCRMNMLLLRSTNIILLQSKQIGFFQKSYVGKNNRFRSYDYGTNISESLTELKPKNIERSLLDTAGVLNKKVEELLGANPSLMETTELINAVQTLEEMAFEQVEKYPWALRKDYSRLWIQSLHNSNCRASFGDLTRQKSFSELCHQIFQRCSSFADHELVSITNNLLRLHVPADSNVIARLIHLCTEKCSTMSLRDLRTLSSATDCMKRSGHHLKSLIIQRFQDLAQDFSVDHKQFDDAVIILHSAGYFCSLQFLHQILTDALVYLTKNCDSSLISLLHYLEVHKYVLAVTISPPFVVLEHLTNHLHELTCWQLARVCVNCNLLHVDNQKIRSSLKDEAVDRLHRNKLTAADVISLTTVFDILGYPKDVQCKIEELLESVVEDFDIILLKYFSKQHLLWQTKNLHLVEQYHNAVTAQMSDLMQSISCTMDVLKCLNQRPSYVSQLHYVMCHTLLSDSNVIQMCCNEEQLATIGCYLIQHHNLIKHSFPEIKTKILDMMPQFSVMNLARLSKRLACINTQTTGSFWKGEIRLIKNELHASFANKLPETKTLEELNMIADASSFLAMAKVNPKFFCHLAAAYKSVIHKVTIKNFNDTCMCLAKKKIFVPEVFDLLTKYFMNHANQLDLGTISNFANALAVANYSQFDVGMLENLVVDIWRVKDKDLNRVPDLLKMLHSFSKLEIFMLPLLSRVFTVDFLLKFDALALEEAKIIVLRNLNRTVVLHCPELDVPWFFARRPNRVSTTYSFDWKENVKESLEALLGGKEYLKSQNVFSEYDHHIDFECRYDQNMNPLPVDNEQRYLPNLPMTRVAINILTPKSYSSNCHNLMGSVTSKLRELEILGYKVVQIPYCDLQSMYLNDDEAKSKYYKTKIFQ